ncbi:hypothetical protein [Allomuricauda sp. NBRC 101325]|uniref:hypothetical protein n=1 Tax=Allomuricauda sp. NBRC 101325 TaxID=1113758 RepID=UPI0024A0A6F5|nr:hypothetical protein [Muricauda sp. NBRC 101325]GLU42649.1 long-chain acyl-[acyl-carrier-protein] reductase [Muricauda sp. NBRC 101325]
MENEAHIDFAVIGHQDNWPSVQSIINGMRSGENEPLTVAQIKGTFSYIPPRSIFKMTAKSKTGKTVNGVYIETFIDPDELTPHFLRKNINKVNEAISVALKHKSKIIALGGFTSIVLEGNLSQFDTSSSKITTGNTLTSAYILKGVTDAILKLNKRLQDCNVLIIGATGDIGSACTHYLSSKVKGLLLNARNGRKLEAFAQQFTDTSAEIKWNTRLEELIPMADIIICVASSASIEIKDYKKQVVICDAGYPKNLDTKIEEGNGTFVFHGGMGTVNYGYDFKPDYREHFYNYPRPHIAHGCILEAVVLAFEGKYENFSSGKGNIKTESIDKIHELSVKHGVELAPFYNSKGLCEISLPKSSKG